ncbi:MAG: DUF1508 domain-containing protein [Patescibacteria group bacterium]
MHEAKFEIYKDRSGEYRWHLNAGNGKIIADSAEGYTSEQSAVSGINLVKSLAPGAKIYKLNY